MPVVFSSLRVRLPLLFLAGIVLPSVVTTLIAIQLFRNFARNQTLHDLRRESAGIAALYSSGVEGRLRGPARRVAPRADVRVARARADDRRQDLLRLPRQPVPGRESRSAEDRPQQDRLDLGQDAHLHVHAAGADRRLLRRRQPGRGRTRDVGAIIVAKQKTAINQFTDSLVRRLAIAFAVGLLVAGAFAWYVSRRLVRPLLRLSHAADEVAAGAYDVEVPRRAPGEIGHLAERFEEMAQRLMESEARERNFLMSVSHELRTPLTAIRGHVSALSEGLVDDPEGRARSLAVVEAEGGRLERLVGDILDLAKLDAHRFTVLREEVGMEQVVERAYETFAEQARSRSIDFSVDDAGPAGDRLRRRPRAADRRQPALERVPRDARRRAGSRSSSARRTAPSPSRSRTTGPGIAPDDRDRLFRPFVSGQGGTGLGLTIARELSHALGGSIELDSELGRGSRFELVLPADAPVA